METNDAKNEKINLTIILGNGFDLNLGLKTSYKNFVEIYKKETPNDITEIKTIKELLNNDDFNWCDLEEKLGEYTNAYSDAKGFSIAHNNIAENLNKYLLKEEDIFRKNLDANDSICIKFIDSVITLIDNYVKKIYKSNELQDKKICIDFVTFNYTTIVDILINKIKSDRSLINKMYDNYYFGNIAHCHGTLYDKMCFGVDNIHQISNEKIFKNASVRYRQELIKPEYNKMINLDYDTSARELISKADVIFAYGCSFGITDYTWIISISASLGIMKDEFQDTFVNFRKNMSKKCKFIIQSHEETIDNFFGTEKKIFEDSIKAKFTFADDPWIDIVYGNIFAGIEKCIKR